MARPDEDSRDDLRSAGVAVLTIDDGTLSGDPQSLELVTGPGASRTSVLLSELGAPWSLEGGATLGLVGDTQLVQANDGRVVELRRASSTTVVAVDVTAHAEQVRTARSANRRYEALLDSATDVLALIGADGAIQWASRSMQDLHGVSAQDAVGQSGFAFVHPKDQARLIDELTWRAQTPGRHRSLTYRAAHVDGTWRVLQMHSSNSMSDPDVAALVVSLRDVTTAAANQRLDAEVATLLRRHAAHVDPVVLLRQLADIGSHYIQVRRPDAYAGLRINPAATIAAAEAGTRSDLRPKRIFFLTGVPKLTDDELAMFSRLAAAARLVIGAAVDRQALRDTEAKLSSTFMNDHMASAIVDLKGNFRRINPAMADLVGVEESALVGRSWRDLMHPDSSPMPPGPVPLLDETVTSLRHLARWRLPNGDDRQILSFLACAYDADGRVSHFVTQYIDVTEQEERLAELTAVNRELGENLELTGSERDRLNSLVSSLADEHERERATLATRLTEEAVQRLVGTRFALGSLGGGPENPEVNEVNDLLESVIEELRTTASGIRPPTLDLFGLEPAVRQMATSLASSGRIVRSKVDDIPRLASSEEILLYRAIAAAAATAARDGVASVDLNLAVTPEEILVVVRDDGPPVDHTRTDELALAAISSQVAARGGTVMVGPRRDLGPGVELVCTLPLLGSLSADTDDAPDQHVRGPDLP